jgi:hypothetical protein
MRTNRLIPLLVVVPLALAACGGSGDDSAETTAVAPAVTESPSNTDAPVSTEPTDTTMAVPPREERTPLTPTVLSAGPITVTATACTVDGVETGDGSADVDDFDLNASHVFLPVETGVAALTYTLGSDCALSLDSSVGDGGILTTADTPESVAASSTGRVAVSSLFGLTVFDLTNGQSYECSDPTGDVDIKDDGSEILSFWSGSPIERYSLSDTTCASVGELALPADFVDWKYAAYDGSDLFLGAEDAAGTTFASRVANDAVQWKVGNPESGSQGWIGWVHGMSRCGAGFCVIDTNTDKLMVLDANGAIRAEFAVSELIGSRLFYYQMRPAADGSVYVLATDSLDDGAGGRYQAIEIFRVEVTG